MAWEDDIVGSDIASAGLHVSERIGKEVASQLDLEETLEASRYASHPYSSHTKEWPPLVEVVDTCELPSVLIDRYNSSGGEGTALCGIFPEIRRAWASVDNSIFLWRFDKCDGQCPEYRGDEQAICAVGFVRSKPGIFVEAIKYLLVLATPVELSLIGICCTGKGDGLDPYEELYLQPLPEYKILSDGVTMTCIACTDKGQIFLAGRDGHIYEMQYSTGLGWYRRCRKVCLTSGFGTLVSRWVALPDVFKFGAIDPVVDMVVDNERHVLYARTEEGKLQAFDLGIDGDGPLKKIAEEKNLTDPRDVLYGTRRSGGSRATNRATRPSIVCISPLPTIESKWLHVVAVLSDGRRLYLSTSSANGGNGSVGVLNGITRNRQKPCCLKVVATRPSPPLVVVGGLTIGGLSTASRSQADDLGLKVETASYSSGTLVLSDSSPPASSSLIIVTRDSSIHPSLSSTFGMPIKSSRALREIVTFLPIEGRMLFVADFLPSTEVAEDVQSLYMDVETCFSSSGVSCEKAVSKLWAKGDLSTQHILPRRRLIVFHTMGLVELFSNRPVDILRKLFELNATRSQIEEFFSHFGAGEAAAMCLMLAAKVLYTEGNLVTNMVSEKAAEVFDDPRLVGFPQLGGVAALPNTRTPPGGFSMGQVVQEAEPVFSGAYEGLCLCSSRLLYPIWELPVMILKRGLGSVAKSEEGVVVCRIPTNGMKILESKIRSLEQFLRSRWKMRRGLYGFVAGLSDVGGSILYGVGSELVTQRNLLGPQNTDFGIDNSTLNKRQRLPHSSNELAAMEVRAMECLRRLLRRSSEALLLLQIISQHHVARLVQRLDGTLRQKLLQLTFHQLVCSEEGDLLATHLISGLMEYYVGPDGRGTVEEISVKLREGCPSFFNESDYKYFVAVESLERALITSDPEERKNLAKDAYDLLSKFPDSADLRTVCKRFEDLRFYEALVRLPLQKAQALDPKGDAVNDKIDPSLRENALAGLKQCYEIITDALRSLKGDAGKTGSKMEYGSLEKVPVVGSAIDSTSRNEYICQIIQLGVQWPDTAFHEHLYKTLIELGLENELLEFGGSDLVSFLQSAWRWPTQEVRVGLNANSPIHDLEVPNPSTQIKYLDLLARYYVLKRQHLLAANILYRLAEKPCLDPGESLTLDKRHQYLSNAVLQAKSVSSTVEFASTRTAVDDGLLEMLEAKLAVLRFQMKIKEELESISRLDDSSQFLRHDTSVENSEMSGVNNTPDIHSKIKELSFSLKSITQLYNDYAVPFNLWEICIEMLNFANSSGDVDNRIVRETWARLLDQALSRGGVAEACSVLKRVGSHHYPSDGISLPLDTLCLHLEKAALERRRSGVELVGDEEVARALLAACRGAPEPILTIYDQLLSNGAIMPSPMLRLHLLRSVLVVLREWAMSVLARKMGTTTAGASIIFGGRLALDHTAVVNQGIRDKILSSANRYMTEIRRLPLPQNQTEAVYRGFRELEESLLAPFPSQLV